VPVLALSEQTGDGLVPCTYCRASIAAAAFVDMSVTGRLVRSACPGCARMVTISRLALRRHREPPDPLGRFAAQETSP
jgi:hypothetical protein